MSKVAVTADSVSKRFRLYHERNQTLKQMVLRGRRARYEEFWALRDISFEIPAGTTVGFIGENGSGKSTLLKCVARILQPDEGTLTMNGSVSALLELGAGFHPELSGKENVFLNGAILGLKGKELKRRYDEIVAFSGIERFIDTPVKNYSSGMYVRLGFSVAINVSPDILLVDEVLAVGDEDFQQRCRQKFFDLQASGCTIVIVSHAMDLIRNLCENAIWLEDGRIKAEGESQDVIGAYMSSVHDQPSEGDNENVGHRRQGTGEAVIEHYELFVDNHVNRVLRSGGPVSVRIFYDASVPIPDPCFVLRYTSPDGRVIAETSTAEHALPLGSIFGKGSLEYEIPELRLVPGTYDLTASLTDRTGEKLFDRRDREIRFDVGQGALPDRNGLLSMGGRWKLLAKDAASPIEQTSTP